ncbi:replication initiation protein [Azotobacter salinestris]|uniref:replication initiation protein n=1 Tax=Azotobacter salinestris TaxID=69964 RepID=UPI0032E04ACD
MPDLIPPMVYKSNALIEASYRLTVTEQRILLACIAQVRRDQPITDEVLYTVTAQEVAELSGTSTKQAYRELEEAALRLKRREVWIKEYPNGGGGRPETLVTGWVQSIRYVPAQGRVRLRFAKDMLPYLAELSEQFTRYALSDVAKMTSAHGIRLYELLRQWGDIGEREIELEQLREWLQLQGCYDSIKDFKKWVIEPAVEQVNEHSPLHVTWDQRKTGRKVTHLTFRYAQKEAARAIKQKKEAPTKQQAIDFEKPRQLSVAELSRLAYPGESTEAALRRLNAVVT